MLHTGLSGVLTWQHRDGHGALCVQASCHQEQLRASNTGGGAAGGPEGCGWAQPPAGSCCSLSWWPLRAPTPRLALLVVLMRGHLSQEGILEMMEGWLFLRLVSMADTAQPGAGMLALACTAKTVQPPGPPPRCSARSRPCKSCQIYILLFTRCSIFLNEKAVNLVQKYLPNTFFS